MRRPRSPRAARSTSTTARSRSGRSSKSAGPDVSEPGAGQVVATLFRRQSGRMTAALVRMLGVRRIDQAEDIVQETLLAALQAWHTELPRDPEGRLFAMMKNRVRDAFRRERVRT